MNQKTGFFSLSFVRGLGGMIAGALVGIVFAMLVRVLMGMPAWKPEPVWVHPVRDHSADPLYAGWLLRPGLPH